MRHVSISRRRAFRWLLLPARAMRCAARLPPTQAESPRRACGRRRNTRASSSRPGADRASAACRCTIRSAWCSISRRRAVARARGASVARATGRIRTSPPSASARTSADSLRLVLDLKAEVRPQVFALPPVAEYGHRLVLDLYPLVPVDPLMALLAARRTRTTPWQRAGERRGESRIRRAGRTGDRRRANPARDRRITIALDPGHGGEDPGAIGRRGTLREERHARDRAQAEGDPRRRARHARDADARRRLLRPARATRRRRRGGCRPTSSSRSTPTRSACRTARGSSVFALSEHGATSAAARWLAQRENAADLIGGVNLDSQRSGARAHAARPFADRADQRQPEGRPRRCWTASATHNSLHKPSSSRRGSRC